MDRHFHSFAIFINVITALLAVVQAWIFWMVGTGMYYLGPFPTWILGSVFFNAIQVIVMLKYFSAMKYTMAFRTGIPYGVSLILTLLVNYSMLDFGYGTQLYIPSSLIAQLLGVVNGIIIVATVPRQNTWLRTAAIYMTLLGLFVLAVSLMVMSGRFIEYNPMIQNFNGPVLWLSIVPPVLLAIHFYRTSPTQREPAESPPTYTFGYPIIGMATLYFIFSFTGAALGMNKWQPDMEAAIMKVAEPFEARTFVDSDGNTLKYRLLKPLNYDPSLKYPIFVALHGGSGEGSDNYKQVAAALFPEFLLQPSNREKYQAFIFVPQCPFGTSWGGVHPLPGVDEIVFEAMAALENEFPVDTSRRYVAGASLGGYGSWHFIESHPEKFAAAIPVCGVGNPSLASKCVDVPVWAFHGAKDTRVLVSGSRDMIDALKKAGGDPKYTEFPEDGHNIGKLVVDTPGLMDWLFEQHK